MNLKDWNKISFEFSNIQDARRTTVFSAILAKLKHFPPQSLLDYGGGDGLFAVDCSMLPIKQIAVYDPAPNMIALARRNRPPDSRIQIVESLKEFQNGGFDIVTFNAVWMCLSTEQECLKVLRDIHRLLKDDGEIIATVTHPCFRDRKFSTYHTDFNLENYLNDGIEFGVTVFDGTKQVQVMDTHWSLSAMSRQLKEAGFIVTEFLELPDQKEGRNLKGASPWLIIFARKAG